jgi:hypothetical protein
MAMFCPSCGVQLVSDTTPFCTHCGSPVKASAQAPVQAAGIAPVPAPVGIPGNRKAGNMASFLLARSNEEGFCVGK